MPIPLHRVAVIGAVGCGKTTLARKLAFRIDVPHIELDALRYQPGWMVVPETIFRERVVESIGTDKWVVDGNYASVQDIIWLRSQLLLWLDFPLSIALCRLIRRTMGRLLTREEFAGGNREQFRRVFSNQSIIIWAIRSHKSRHKQYEQLLASPRYAHLQVIRLSSPDAVRVWLTGIPNSL